MDRATHCVPSIESIVGLRSGQVGLLNGGSGLAPDPPFSVLVRQVYWHPTNAAIAAVVVCPAATVNDPPVTPNVVDATVDVLISLGEQSVVPPEPGTSACISAFANRSDLLL